MLFFTSNNLFCNEQHGFRSKRSYEIQLLSIMEHWSRVIEDGFNVDVIYLDFQKAFDKVRHCHLLTKLKAYGIQGRVFNWMKNFYKIINKESQFVDHILTGQMLIVAFPGKCSGTYHIMYQTLYKVPWEYFLMILKFIVLSLHLVILIYYSMM